MDIVTHGLLGALVAQSISRSRNLRLASFLGCVAALTPDLDVLIQSSSDPLLVLEYHRHFTHSIFFAPLAALLLTLLCAPLVYRDLSRAHLFAIVLLAYVSACLLDVCTSYGTHLLWPLVPEPMALSIIAVVDPLFTSLLAIAVISAWVGHHRQYAWLGIVLLLGYLLLGWTQHQRAQAAAEALAAERQLSAVSIDVKPTIGNLLLWRVLTLTSDNQLQVDAIRVGISTRIYPGERRDLATAETWPQLSPESRAYRDLLRYQQLNRPLLVIHSKDTSVIGDARYAMLPTSADPLWGLRINPAQQNAPTEFVTLRHLDQEQRQVFIDMLLGRSLPLAKSPGD